MSTFETGGLPGGMPDLPPGQMTLELQPSEWWLLRIGRAKRTKQVWPSMDEAEKARDLLAAKLPKPTATRAPRATTARTRKPKAAQP